jgi:hypothetical protein
MREVATRDFIRSELKSLLEEMEEAKDAEARRTHEEQETPGADRSVTGDRSVPDDREERSRG